MARSNFGHQCSEFTDLIVIQFAIRTLKDIGADFKHQSLRFHGCFGGIQLKNDVEIRENFRKEDPRLLFRVLPFEFPTVEV